MHPLGGSRHRNAVVGAAAARRSLEAGIDSALRQTPSLAAPDLLDGRSGLRVSLLRLDNVVEPWSPTAQRIREQLVELSGWHFNSLLLNLYRDGRDAMGFHADDEPELNPEAPIASLSLGSAAPFASSPRRDIKAAISISSWAMAPCC